MELFWSNACKIAILLNPFAVLSTFLALAATRSKREKYRIISQTTLTVIISGIVVMFSGELLFKLLDINLDLFKIGGGTILLVCSISLVWGKDEHIKDVPSASIAVVPLAIPMALGPGTAAGLLIIGAEGFSIISQSFMNVIALLFGVAVLTFILSLGVWTEKLLNKTVISVITRLTGLFLSAIAAKMLLEGLKSCLQL